MLLLTKKASQDLHVSDLFLFSGAGGWLVRITAREQVGAAYVDEPI